MSYCEKTLKGGNWIYFSSDRPDFSSPVQGIWCNCTFIAGLISVCWVNPRFFPKLADPSTAVSYQYYFWDETTSSKIEVQITPSLCVIDPAAFPPSFCGAKCSQFSTSNEVWPGLNEKAYAKFCLYKKGVITSLNNLKDPAFWPRDAAGNLISPCTLTDVEWGGNPVITMVRITGCSAISYLLFSKNANGFPNRDSPTKLYYSGCNKTGTTDFYSFLKYCFCSVSSYKTSRPMVAWTYGAEEGIDPTTRQTVRYIPSDCHYTANGIQANHSYSILGMFEPGDGNQYIVLRDPCGIDPSDSGIKAKLYSPATGEKIWAPVNKYFKLCNQEIYPTGTIAGIPARYSIYLSAQDGIFGLLTSEFAKYFEGIGWLT